MQAPPLFTSLEINAIADALAGRMRIPNPSTGETKSRPRHKDIVDEIMESLPEAARAKADKIYKMWSERKPDMDLVTRIVWPEDQIMIGHGRKIGYRSDKWNKPGDTKDYIHDFDQKHPPRVIMERPGSAQIRGADKDWFKHIHRLSPRQKIPPPKVPILIGLGFALDVEFVSGGMIRQIDWKDSPSLPWLLIDTERNLLIIQQETGSPAVLLDSKVVEITARGIEN